MSSPESRHFVPEFLPEARGAMSTEELGALLNTLLEAERAGAAVLTAFTHQFEHGTWAREEMRRMQRDEAHNCGVLIGLLGHIGVERSRATGAFLGKVLAIRGPAPRLEFLNRGQDWVERRIAAALPRIADARVHRALEAMRLSHSANIAACDALLATSCATVASSKKA